MFVFRRVLLDCDQVGGLKASWWTFRRTRDASVGLYHQLWLSRREASFTLPGKASAL